MLLVMHRLYELGLKTMAECDVGIATGEHTVVLDVDGNSGSQPAHHLKSIRFS
jgi:hypothetical protein